MNAPLPPLHAAAADHRTAAASLADPAAVLRPLLAELAAEAATLDTDGAFPVLGLSRLAEAGLLAAPLPPETGGHGLGILPDAADALAEVLRLIGGASLSLGRLYEGHVNALRLVHRYGTPAQRAAAAESARAGALFAVWNTDDAAGLHLDPREDGRFRLRGRKILCSGSGFAARALVTARVAGEAAPRMLLVPLEPGQRADLSDWTPQGMRASATGAMDFTGIEVGAAELLGDPGDYTREPDFSGGAWRFAAVHLGGVEALVDGLRAHLRRTGRGGDPYQLARLGAAVMAAETAGLWVRRASRLAEGAEPAAPERRVAAVQLCRLAVERAGLDVLELVQRSVGLAAFMRPAPLERIARDLATYLRQPAPDRTLAAAAEHVLAAAEPTGELWP